MLKSATGAALCASETNGGVAYLERHLRRCDPVLRPLVRRKLRRLLAIAMDHTSVRIDDEFGERHHLRVAMLLLARVNANFDDVATVRTKYEACCKDFGQPVWWLTAVASAIACVGAAVLAFRMFMPPPEAHFRKSPLGVALHSPLTDYVVAASQGLPARELDQLRGQILAPDVIAQMGPSAERLFDSALRDCVMLRAMGGAERGVEMHRWTADVIALDDEFQRTHLPAFVLTYEDWRGDPLLLSYFAHDRHFVTLGEDKRDVVWGRRLDTLNVVNPSRAYSSADERTVVVDLDVVEAQVLTSEMTAFGEIAGFPGQPEGADAVTPFQRTAAAALREGTSREAHVDPALAVDLGTLLWRRHKAFANWDIHRQAGEPVSFRWPEKLVRRLEGDQKNGDAQELATLNQRLLDYEPEFRRLVDVFATLEEEFFVRFMADADRYILRFDAPSIARHRPTRAALAANLGMLWSLATLRYVVLAELVKAATEPQDTSNSHIQEGGWGALWLLEAELGIEHDWVDENGTVDGVAMTASVRRLFEQDSTKLGDAARQAFHNLLGIDPPALSKTAEKPH